MNHFACRRFYISAPPPAGPGPVCAADADALLEMCGIRKVIGLMASPAAPVDNHPGRCAGAGDLEARRSIECAQLQGRPLARRRFRVVRSGEDSAAITVMLPVGRRGTICFTERQSTSAGTSHDGGRACNAIQASDWHHVIVSAERFKVRKPPLPAA